MPHNGHLNNHGDGLLVGRQDLQLCLAGENQQRERKDAGPVLLVAPFENLSSAKCMVTYEVATGSDPNNPKRSFRVDRYSEAPRAILKDILGEIPGVKVGRKTTSGLDFTESEFGRLSGLVDPEKAVKLGKLLGATAIVMGTVLDVGAKTRQFSGYGISTHNTVVAGSVRVRIINIIRGMFRFPNDARFRGLHVFEVRWCERQ